MEVTTSSDLSRLANSSFDDSVGLFDSTSPSELSSKQKGSQRRNPWGNKSYADLITLAIQSAPGEKIESTMLLFTL